MYTKTPRTKGVTVTLLDLSKQEADALAFYQQGHPDDTDMTEAHTEKGWALAVAPNGDEWLVCEEGVAFLVQPEGNTFEVWMSGDHSFQMFPAVQFTLTRDEVHEHATGATVDLADHVRVFGGRLEDNFWSLHRTLTESV